MICVTSVLHKYSLKNILKSFNFYKIMNFSTNSKIKTIEFKTCGQLYEKLKKTNPKLYGNSPSDGLSVNVEYVDTFCDNDMKNNSDVKTVVAIHGNPGHHKHFSGLIDYFDKNDSNVRMIVPNMPDFSITRKTMAFWHSNEERSQFIRDFLRAINIWTVDCFISHSAGIHPISLIWSDPRDLKVNSIAIFSPQCVPQKFFKINKILSIFSRNKIGITLMDRIKPHILLKGRSPMSYSSVDEVLYFVLVHSYLQNSQFYEYLEILKSLRIPTLVSYGESDKLIPSDEYEKFVQRLGADTRDLVIYSNDRQIEKHCDRENWLKVLVLRGGGHFCYAKYIEEVSKQLEKHCIQLKSKL